MLPANHLISTGVHFSGKYISNPRFREDAGNYRFRTHDSNKKIFHPIALIELSLSWINELTNRTVGRHDTTSKSAHQQRTAHTYHRRRICVLDRQRTFLLENGNAFLEAHQQQPIAWINHASDKGEKKRDRLEQLSSSLVGLSEILSSRLMPSQK